MNPHTIKPTSFGLSVFNYISFNSNLKDNFFTDVNVFT